MNDTQSQLLEHRRLLLKFLLASPLSSFGQEGVEAVLDILRKEFEMTMQQAGTTTIRQINTDFIAS